MSLIDTAEDTVTQTVPASGYPIAVAASADGDAVYVVAEDASALDVFSVIGGPELTPPGPPWRHRPGGQRHHRPGSGPGHGRGHGHGGPAPHRGQPGHRPGAPGHLGRG
jgi:DNA-binding beta-propeller fold protein YncE